MLTVASGAVSNLMIVVGVVEVIRILLYDLATIVTIAVAFIADLGVGATMTTTGAIIIATAILTIICTAVVTTKSVQNTRLLLCTLITVTVFNFTMVSCTKIFVILAVAIVMNTFLLL